MAGQPFAQDRANSLLTRFLGLSTLGLRDPNRDGCRYYRSILSDPSYRIKVISIYTLLRHSDIFLADDGDTSEWTEVSDA